MHGQEVGQLALPERNGLAALRRPLPVEHDLFIRQMHHRSVDRTVVQVRKRSNRLPIYRELSIVRKWADGGGPTLATSLIV